MDILKLLTLKCAVIVRKIREGWFGTPVGGEKLGARREELGRNLRRAKIYCGVESLVNDNFTTHFQRAIGNFTSKDFVRQFFQRGLST